MSQTSKEESTIGAVEEVGGRQGREPYTDNPVVRWNEIWFPMLEH